MENPPWNPGIAGAVGNAKDEGGREKKPRGQSGRGLGKNKGEKSDDGRQQPGNGLPEEDGHRGE